MKQPRRSTTVDEFIETRVLPEYRDIVSMIRRAMREHAPESEEVLTYGILGFRNRRIIALISPTKKGITFNFTDGGGFEDPYGLLEGVGHKTRNVRWSTLEQFDVDAMRSYLRQAVAADSR